MLSTTKSMALAMQLALAAVLPNAHISGWSPFAAIQIGSTAEYTNIDSDRVVDGAPFTGVLLYDGDGSKLCSA